MTRSIDRWKQIAKAWTRLEILSFVGKPPLFTLDWSQTVHTVQWKYGTATLGTIPGTIPHTLRVVGLRNMHNVCGQAIEYLFYRHFRSLERFEVDADHSIALIQPLLLAQAVNLQYFRIRSRGAINCSIMEDTRTPPSLIELAVDWPDCTPQKALRFIKGSRDGQLKILDIRVTTGNDGDWEEVRETAKSFRIRVSYQ